METAFAVALGVLFLGVFYGVVRIDWPEAYFAPTDVSAYVISAKPLRYLLFRVAPVFVVALLAAVTLDRLGRDGGIAAVAVGAVHSSLTLGRAIINWIRSPQRERARRASIAAMRAVVLVAVVGAAFGAAASRNYLSVLVPDVTELINALWTALFAGTIGAFLVHLSSGAGVGAQELATRSLRELPPRLLVVAGEAAEANDADEILVGAVMVVENIQRPPWFRTLERLKSRVVKGGTYGIMQVEADRPLTDEDSIRKAVAEHFSGVNVRTTGQKSYADPKKLRLFALKYNGTSNFHQLLQSAYYVVGQSQVKSDEVV